MKGSWKEYLLDMVASSDFSNSDVVDSAAVRKQIEGVILGNAVQYNAGKDAWVSLMPYLWEKSVLKAYRKPAVL